jgi:integrase
VRLHDLRHGAASIALAAGADIKTIQQMLGHSSPITALETYISVLPDLAHAAAEAAARLLLAAAGRRRLALLGASQA